MHRPLVRSNNVQMGLIGDPLAPTRDGLTLDPSQPRLARFQNLLLHICAGKPVIFFFFFTPPQNL